MAAAYGLTTPEVAELYSPPRVTDFGEKRGILSGVLLTSQQTMRMAIPGAFVLKVNDRKRHRRLRRCSLTCWLGRRCVGLTAISETSI